MPMYHGFMLALVTHDTNTVSVSVRVAVSADVSWIHAGISYPMILTLCL